MPETHNGDMFFAFTDTVAFISAVQISVVSLPPTDHSDHVEGSAVLSVHSTCYKKTRRLNMFNIPMWTFKANLINASSACIVHNQYPRSKHSSVPTLIYGCERIQSHF